MGRLQLVTPTKPLAEDQPCPGCGRLESSAWLEAHGFCEACQHERQRLQRLLDSSGLPPRARKRSFATLDRSLANSAALAACEAWGFGPQGLFLWGPVGTGKSYLCHCLAMREILEHRRTTLFFSVPRLLFELRASFGRDGGGRGRGLVDRASRYQLLVLDDLGAERATEWALEIIFMVIDTRLERELPLVATSNLNLSDLAKQLGQRVADRIVEACRVVRLDGESLRVRQAKLELPDQHGRLPGAA